MIVLTAYGFLKPGTADAAFSASRKNKAFAVGEKGCERFDFYSSVDDPSKFVFVEEWTTKEDLDAHFASPNFAEFFAAIGDCLTGPPEIRIFEASLLSG